MHIELSRDGIGRAVLRARRGPEDRPLPVDGLIFDAAPVTRESDRVAVAGTLLFARYADSTIGFADPISERVAEAITAATGLAIDSRVLPALRSEEASEVATGKAARPQVTTLTVALGSRLPEATPGIDRARLDLLPGERYSGALYGVKELLIASNAWLLASHLDRGAVMTAAGIIFADDLFAGTIELDGESREDEPSQAARELCREIGLTLS